MVPRHGCVGAEEGSRVPQEPPSESLDLERATRRHSIPALDPAEVRDPMPAGFARPSPSRNAAILVPDPAHGPRPLERELRQLGLVDLDADVDQELADDG